MRALVLVLTGLVGIKLATAQARSLPESPTRVLEAAFAALDQGDYERLVTLIDTSDLQRFRRSSIFHVSSTERWASQPFSRPESVSPCVAAYLDSMMRQYQAPRMKPGTVFERLGVTDTVELARLAPSVFFVRWMRANASLVHQDDSLFWTGRREDSGPPHIPEMRYKRSVLGVVLLGVSLAYVLYQNSPIAPSIDSSNVHQRGAIDTLGPVRVDTMLVYVADAQVGPQIASLRNDRQGHWRLSLDGDPLGRSRRILEP